MQRLKTDQRSKIKQFVSYTRAPEHVAHNFLTKANWNLEYAAQLYYDNPRLFDHVSSSSIDKRKLEAIFNRYAGNPQDNLGADRMGPHGVFHLLNDLCYEPTDRKVLILACKLKAQTQCEFTADEWNLGLTALKADSIEKLRERLDQINSEIDLDKQKFRELYVFTFTYGKQSSQRNLDIETALQYWQILLGDRFPILVKWEKFLKDQNIQVISRDTWNLLLDFLHMIKPDLSDYDDDGAWPVLLDQFVEWARDAYGLPKPTDSGVEESAPNYSSTYY